MMNYTPYINKQSIEKRMLKLAANHLGVSQTELLDPVVNLFLESLSEEVYKISGEIENIENRILNKLFGILTPGIDVIAKPAHCILHACAQNNALRITTHSEFNYSARGSKKQFSFYPVCNTNIYNGEIRYFIHKGLMYSMDQDLSKTFYARSDEKNKFDENTFWLGLELDDSIDNISGLSFYFDLHGIFKKEEYLNLLPYAVWTIQGEAISMNKGILSLDEEYENDTQSLFTQFDLSHQINESVKKHYKNRFLTVAENYSIKDKREILPFELQTYFTEEIKIKLKKPLLWIKVSCPQGFTPDVIESLQSSINAFPVVNKKLVSSIREVKKSVPVIPLKTFSNESFISVCNVSDSQGKRYCDIPVNDTQITSYGIYSLRRGGYERYNNRDATEYLATITDVLNSEISSFFKNKNDIKSDLKKIQVEITELVKRLEKTLSESKERYEIETYLQVNPDKENEIYFVDYWITEGAQANNIKAGMIFNSLSGLPIQRSSIITLCPTIGGKYAPQGEMKNSLYKKVLTENNLLVTDNDIEEFCLQEFHESICEVKVCQGTMKSDNPINGFIRTTDVYIKPHKDMEEYIGDKNEEYFKQILKRKSPATYNYRVFINKILPN
ncbi:type VI secretion system baseplate subunit TssF [Dysgonomonas sp. ZJ709]|uniref:type VI secretion system baseplate subunit TssF n=1 Tax=Dysgonomonas sp. ZJ709 TaxID=2709797 RepID=UPI0013EB3C7E|nr:type VI secretion system baseplate subunit TssF [Dysgonomonas sp. ZJ709]